MVDKVWTDCLTLFQELQQQQSQHQDLKLGLAERFDPCVVCGDRSSGKVTSLTVKLLSPGQNGQHFADDLFRSIFVNEKFCILIKISLKFVLKCLINNKPALV